MSAAGSAPGSEQRALSRARAAHEAGRPVVFGLCGGVAAGKSTVANLFSSLGAATIDADQVGHAALTDPAIRDMVTARFGSDMLLPDKSVNRKRLGERVFNDPDARRALEAITHPWIRAQIRSRLDGLLTKGGIPAVVLDVSLLLESGAYVGDLDVLVFVDTPSAVRSARASGARGWESSEVPRREGHQMGIADKQRLADVTLANDGTVADLEGRVRDLWQRFVR